MKKKVKRKYTRHEKVAEPKPDALVPISRQSELQSSTSPIKEESSIILPIEVYSAPYEGKEDILIGGQLIQGTDSRDKIFTFDDLPLSLRGQVEFILSYRKRLGLPDDSKERKSQAIKMFRGDRPR